MNAIRQLGTALFLASWIGSGFLLGRTDVDPKMPVLLGLTALVLTLPVWLATRAHQFDPAEPVWLLTMMFALSFWLRPVLVLHDPESYAAPFVSYDGNAMIGASSIALMGLVGFYVGYYSRLPRSLAPALPRLRWPWSRARVLFALVGFAALFAYLGLYFFAKGQFSFEYIYANRPLLNWGDGDLAQLIQLAGWFVVVLALALDSMSRQPSMVRRLAFIATTSAVLGILSIFGARWSLFFILGSLIIMRHYRGRRLGVRTWIVTFLCFFVASALFGAWRQTLDLDDIRPELFVQNVMIETHQYLEWDVLSEIVSLYPAIESHSHGLLGLETLFWLVPRRLWPAKPVWYGTTTIQSTLFPGILDFADDGGFIGTFLTLSIAGEGYVEFGWVGAVLYMFLVGVVWRLIYEFKEINGDSFPAVAVYAVLAVSIPIHVRAFATGILVVFAWFVLHLIVFGWLGGVARRAPALNPERGNLKDPGTTTVVGPAQQ